ncbi:MAG: biotin/lipoyl-binding protein [Blautia sp.]|nr:biotin/lipoyl-binding protein [Blautia sp.]
MAKKGLIILGVLSVLAVSGLGAWQFYFKDRISIGETDETAYVTRVGALTGENLGVQNWYAGVVEPQSTIKVNLDSGRKVKEVAVSVGDTVHEGDLLYEYDLSSLQDDLKQAQLDLDRLRNEMLNIQEQIVTLEKEKQKAKASAQLSYTIEIESNRMSLKKNEYDQISKQNAIDKLVAATENTQVLSEVDGVIQKIDTSKLSTEDGDSLTDSGSDMFMDESSDNSFITILGTGNYRIKGMVNEQNRHDIVPGEAVIIRSRADSTQIWRGIMGTVDEQNSQQSSDSMWGFTDSSDTQTNSTSYPFYVDLESSEDLMLGQHVYIEPDQGQSDRPEGLWLNVVYISDINSESPYVWADNGHGRLEKRVVVLGEYDDENIEYQILDGLTTADYIAYPDTYLREGLSTVDSSTVDIEDEELGEEDWDLEFDDGGYGFEDFGEEVDDMEYDFDDAEFGFDDEAGIAWPEDDEMIGDTWLEDEEMEPDAFGMDSLDDFSDEAVMYDSDDTEDAG